MKVKVTNYADEKKIYNIYIYICIYLFAYHVHDFTGFSPPKVVQDVFSSRVCWESVTVGQDCFVMMFVRYTWRIIPSSKWLKNNGDRKSARPGVTPLPNGRTSWLTNGGDPNYLQVLG